MVAPSMRMTSATPIIALPLLLLLHSSFVLANTEKVIFLGPEPVTIPGASPTLAELRLDVLTPEKPAIRTNLGRVFPTEVDDNALGQSTWLLLDNLTEAQRYELRVCWAAIEPTSFTLDVYDLNTVWETPELVQSLHRFSVSRQPDSSLVSESSGSHEAERSSSVQLLRVRAAADYFTDSLELMQNPPPVLVDLILDPYLLNVVPQSLLPTIGCVLVVATVSWLLAKHLATWLQTIAQSPAVHDKKQL
ncbi:hypothetical protein B0I35DRAFT_477549 [Stachybotrys elegans]|uniref:Uncharacterized protein n=1 Tax=Stachybotrys elegans TaxID=80388 RepID=A0A8K0WSN5_9HYPO|nr:hypothetical protein B0I35DRAFT_477549 [Stachybotrys elegans]